MPAPPQEPTVSQESTPPPPVRQRNTTPYTYTVAETEDHPAYAVLPGETADLPALLDGWTAVGEGEPDAGDDSADEAAPSAEAEAESSAPKKTTPSRRRAAAADTDQNGGEPR